MKNDDFEKQLQKQTLRPVPEHWRNQILQQAREGKSQDPAREKAERPQRERALPWWHQLLWPCPQAWGALAAVWVVVFALNFNSGENKPQMATVAAPSREVLMALKQQRQLRAELLSASDVPVAEPPKWSAPHSRVGPAVTLFAA